MMRRLVFICMLMASVWAVPVFAETAEAYLLETSVMQDKEISISYNDGILYVNGGENQVLSVVSLTGRKVLEITLDSPAQRIEFSAAKGCYIIKVGEVVRKISVR